MATYNEFQRRGETPVFFDTDRKILVNCRNLQEPIPNEEVPWFSTRYPVKLMLQPVCHGVPVVIGQPPLTLYIKRGNVEYGTVTGVGVEHPWFVIPRMDVPVGPLDITVRDGLGNIVLQFKSMALDVVPEYPGFIPTVYSNPNSVRIPDEGERVIRQPYARAIRLQRDASIFIIEDIPTETSSVKLSFDVGSLALNTYYGCNRLLVKAFGPMVVSSDSVEVRNGSLSEGWHEARVTVNPDGSILVLFFS